MNIGDKIKQNRRIAGVSQGNLGELVDVSLKTVQRWENGERSPRIDEIENIAKVLNISVEYLMDLDDSPAKKQTEKSTINNEDVGNVLDLGFWGSVVERAKQAAKVGDTQTLALVAALLQSAVDAVKNAGANGSPQVVGIQGGIQ